MQRQLKTVLIVAAHVASWFIFLSLPTLFNPRRETLDLAGFIDDLLIPFRWRNGLLLISLFYFNFYVAIPRLYFKHKYYAFGAYIAGCFAVFVLVNYMFPPGVSGEFPRSIRRPHPGTLPTGFHYVGPSFNLFMFLMVFISSFGLRIYNQWQKTKEEKLSAEISFLKAQINPHFLFNTLNSIYSLTITKSDKAPDAVVRLSGLMRYAVSDAAHDFVSLEKEIDYISNFVDLQRLRLTHKIKLDYEVAGNTIGKTIAPFLLIPFVENAFKYGVNSEENSDIRIRIDIGENDLTMHAFNNKVSRNTAHDQGAGLGIRTTRQRLDLLHPGAYSLDLNDNAENFEVLLNIRLKK